MIRKLILALLGAFAGIVLVSVPGIVLMHVFDNTTLDGPVRALVGIVTVVAMFVGAKTAVANA